MKVYFEIKGYSWNKGKPYTSIQVYVKPGSKTKDCHAYEFCSDGKLSRFAWARPRFAKIVESEELSKTMWYSIRHGSCNMYTDGHYDSIQQINIDKLQYVKVKKSETEAWIKATEGIKKVKTLDDFKKLYPTIKKSGRVSWDIATKLIKLYGWKQPPEVNGEIGICFMYKMEMYKQILKELRLEK